MHKIYSRKKIHLPFLKQKRSSKLQQSKKEKIIKICSVLIIAFSVVIIMIKSVSPIFEKLCEDEAKSIATIISNNEATAVMREHTYDEIFTIEKDKEGNITMVKSNVLAVNEIISSVAVRIQEKINAEGKDDIAVALGSFSGIKLLAGRGPYVKIRISSIGSVETDLRSEFISQGINQTLHRVYLQVVCQISILTPFSNITREITNQVLLAENVIVGNIPSTYYNLEGLEKSNDALELVE